MTRIVFQRVIAATAALAVTATALAIPAQAAVRDPSEVAAAPAKPAAKTKKKVKYCFQQPVEGSRIERLTCKERIRWIVEDNVDPVRYL